MKNQISAAKLFLIPGVIFGSAMFATQAQAATFISIDNFDTTPVLSTEFGIGAEPGTQTDSGTFSEDDVFGGTRVITHTLESGFFGTSSTVGLVGPDIGVLSLSDGAGVTSSLSVLYDAGGAGLGRDLSPFFFGFFEFDVITIDLAAELTLTITDFDGGVSTSTLSGIDDPTAVSFPLDTFVGSADVSDIFSLELEITGDEALDVIIDAIGFGPGVIHAPEPATVLGLVTLAGLAVASKKRKQA